MRIVSVPSLIISVCLIGCQEPNEVVEVQRPRISMTVSGLPHLEEVEGHYELWAKFVIFDKNGQSDSPQHDSTAVSLGEFNVSEDGKNVEGPEGGPAQFSIPVDQNPQLIDVVFITIQEPDSDLAKVTHGEQGPALLGGNVVGDATVGVAELNIAHAEAIGSSFSNVTGRFTITAPTSPADSNSGVWFIEEQNDTPSVGLKNLPKLPEGWVYEGWVGFPQIPIEPGSGPSIEYFSTGRFTRADSADFDGAGPGKGAGTAWNFPGEDYINAYTGGPPSRPDLRYSAFMITVEPEPDNSPDPFPLTILSTQPTPTPLPQGQALSMNNVAASSSPHARITIVRSGY